jgi:hypothetical protein
MHSAVLQDARDFEGFAKPLLLTEAYFGRPTSRGIAQRTPPNGPGRTCVRRTCRSSTSLLPRLSRDLSSRIS